MTAVAFDTLRFVRTLRDKAKMSPEQAEGLADAVSEAIQGDLATKADVEALRLSTKADLDAVRTEITALSHRMDISLSEVRADLKLLEQRMTVKLGGMLVAVIGILIAAIRYLPPAGH